MDPDDLIGLLPVPYAIAVRLRRAGATDAAIAVAAAVDEAAVEPLIHLAEAKLRTLAAAGAAPADPLAAPLADPPTTQRAAPPPAVNPLEVLP